MAETLENLKKILKGGLDESLALKILQALHEDLCLVNIELARDADNISPAILDRLPVSLDDLSEEEKMWLAHICWRYIGINVQNEHPGVEEVKAEDLKKVEPEGAEANKSDDKVVNDAMGGFDADDIDVLSSWFEDEAPSDNKADTSDEALTNDIDHDNSFTRKMDDHQEACRNPKP